MSAPDPIRRFRRWLADAKRAGIELPERCVLATADRRGRPSVRYMLLKGADAEGFTFFTNAGSRKGRQLRANPRAALAFYWHETDRQVRVEGRVVEVDSKDADAYWRERPHDSKIASLVSRQSRQVDDRSQLLAAYSAAQRKYAHSEPPRPPRWTGFVVVPDSIEFWIRREPRLHQRELFEKTKSGWRRSMLQP